MDGLTGILIKRQKLGCTHTREDHVKTEETIICDLGKASEETALLTRGPWTGLRKCERMNFCWFEPPALGIML